MGLGTAWNFALGLPKHDLGWPSLRPLCRDSMMREIFERKRERERERERHCYVSVTSGNIGVVRKQFDVIDTK